MPRPLHTATITTIAKKKSASTFFPVVLMLVASAIFSTTPVSAQQLTSISSSSDTSVASLPDAPQPQTDSSPAPSDQTGGQTKRILGVIPNFRSVNAHVHLPPQSMKEKFSTATQDSFDYSSVVLPATVAAISFSRNSTPEFGTGGVGYSRYLWHTVVDQTIENYMVEFFVPAATHEDTRFYTLGSGGFAKRGSYAITRVLVTRTDSGKRAINFGEIIGAGAGAGISNFYYPRPERTLSNTLSQWGLNVAIDGVTFVSKEFWPDINHYLFRGEKPSQIVPATPSH